MEALPNITATETADLRDVYQRLRDHLSIVQVAHFLGNGLYRFENWLEAKIYPRWF
jgi:hypothetical protein